MRTLLLAALLVVSTEAAAQVKVETAPGGYTYAFSRGDPDRPMIGISTRNSGKRDTLGLLVESVTRDGPAEKAGIEEGDRLVSANGVNLRLSAADAGEPDMDGVANRRLIRELEKRKAGDEVELRVYRDGNVRTVKVKTVTADELNQGTFASTTSGFRRINGDRAALGITLGGNGSRRDTLGVLVVGVANEGPAAKAGIDEGDRVASINGVDLRVASEDAGDGQASSARINRLNREMEKVKAGDAVELRVYNAGQVRTVRVESAKASDIEGESFFFGPNGLYRTMVMPRGAIRLRPPSAEFDGVQKEKIEEMLRQIQAKVKTNIEPTIKLQEKLKTEALRKAMVIRQSSIL
jgi:predicted metalloprotease with PDZ domain